MPGIFIIEYARRFRVFASFWLRSGPLAQAVRSAPVLTEGSPKRRTCRAGVRGYGVATFAACVGMTHAAHATYFYVTDTQDSYTQGDGVCSLREAVDTANWNDCWTDCGCGSAVGPDYVFLVAGSTYTLQSALDIWDNLELDGDAANPPIIRPGSGANSGIVIWSNASYVILDDFSLRGFSNPALHVNEYATAYAHRLSIRDNVYTGNLQTASVLANTGSYLYMANSMVFNNQDSIKGGGIYVQTSAQVDLVSSTVSYNGAIQYGGGVFVRGTFNCSDSIITQNSVRDYLGGGVYQAAGGTSSLSACIVENNNAPGPKVNATPTRNVDVYIE